MTKKELLNENKYLKHCIYKQNEKMNGVFDLIVNLARESREEEIMLIKIDIDGIDNFHFPLPNKLYLNNQKYQKKEE